jgi:hypothetical protein
MAYTPALPGLLAVALMVLWAAKNGGYDAGTWYWGALILLAGTALTVVWLGPGLRLSRGAKRGIACFAVYLAWSYLSIAWASSPGDALQGSSRALLYLLVFTLFAILPWTAEAALVALVTFTLGVGTIAVVLLFRLAGAAHVAALVISGRLAAPTGYFNATVALFTIGALLSTSLSVRRELPALLRGLLIAFACACLQLAVVGQSRGWLFTLPIVLVVAAVLAPNRFRFAAAAVIPAVATVIPIHRLLGVFADHTAAALNHAAQRAGQAALLLCLAAFVLGTVLAYTESRVPPPRLSPRHRRTLGASLVALALAAGAGGAVVATHGDPVGFVKRQWNGFSHTESAGVGSHFSVVGSGRYDFWRVALDAVVAYPIGGLGQDNFGDWYITRRRTREEPAWPHSLELRLLACTGVVGFGLLVAFLAFSLVESVRAVRNPGGLGPAVSAAALLPIVVWLVHGSVDWFWEMPALSAPALGFLGMAVALGRPPPVATDGDRRSVDARRSRAWLRPARIAIGGLVVVAAALVLSFSYLSVQEIALAGGVSSRNPRAALGDLALAARLNPLSPVPGRLGGTLALENGLFAEAEKRYQQAIDREPGGWYSWFGKGLAASALGDEATAARALSVAARIEKQQPAIREALARLATTHPMKPLTALRAIKLIQ